MNTPDLPLLEYDSTPSAILNPRPVKLSRPAPARAVISFFNNLLLDLEQKKILVPVGELRCESGAFPLYWLDHLGEGLLVFHPGVGASLAGGFLEEVITLGVKKFIACGGCGVLQKEIAVGHVVLVSSAVRDEGTSYHYLPPSREVTPSPNAIQALETTCQEQGVPYLLGKTWTTDGLYRETEAKRSRRVEEGCLTVEMEAAALFAIAQFRGVDLGQILYGGDLVVPEGWDKRNWYNRQDIRERLFWLAVEACLKMT